MLQRTKTKPSKPALQGIPARLAAKRFTVYNRSIVKIKVRDHLSQREQPHHFVVMGLFLIIPGGDLLSHTATRAVSSALRGLTSVFGMGTGVAPSA